MTKLTFAETANLLYALRVGVDALQAEVESLRHLKEEFGAVGMPQAQAAAQLEMVLKTRLAQAEKIHSLLEFAVVKDRHEIVLVEKD